MICRAILGIPWVTAWGPRGWHENLSLFREQQMKKYSWILVVAAMAPLVPLACGGGTTSSTSTGGPSAGGAGGSGAATTTGTHGTTAAGTTTTTAAGTGGGGTTADC